MSEIAIQAKSILSHVEICRQGKIKISNPKDNIATNIFLITTLIVSVFSFLILPIDWIKIASRVPDLGVFFGRLAVFSFNDFGLTITAFTETVTVTILATIYSVIIGLILGAFAARNLVKNRFISYTLTSFFTFLRAVPTPVWVLLALVCLGFGPASGIVGLSVHSVAFFAKAFSQCFEDVPYEVIEALEVTGANKIQIFFSSVLPSALSSIVAWTGLRFEINFSEAAILGMVGAGGIGFAITGSIQGYKYGEAGLAIFLVFVFAYLIEILFTQIKKKYT